MRELRRRIQTTRTGRARRRVELVADDGVKHLSPERQARMSTFCLNLSNYELKPTREERYTNASQSADAAERNLREAETTLIQATAAFDTMDGDESVIEAVRESLDEQQSLVDALAELSKAKRAFADGMLAECLKPHAPDRAKLDRIVRALDKREDGGRNLEEVRLLFSKLLHIPLQDIPEEDREVSLFAQLKDADMVNKLLVGASAESIANCYDALFPAAPMLLEVSIAMHIYRLLTNASNTAAATNPLATVCACPSLPFSRDTPGNDPRQKQSRTDCPRDSP
jgi:hypothetical protein